MGFWSDTTLDPKRQFKFKVTFPFNNMTAAGGSGGNQQDAVFLAQYADRPTYQITDGTKVHFLEKEFSFPGKITWNPVKIRFVDASGVGSINVSQKSYEYLAKSGWIAPNNAPGNGAIGNLSTINKSAAMIDGIKIEVLNSAGVAVDTWELKNAFITTAVLNNLDYSQEGILTAEYNIRYDWATWTAGPGNR